jgi:tRNA(adenine34) deaminase
VTDQKFMRLAISEALSSFPDVPVGAILLGPTGKMVAKNSNRRIRDNDPSAHAELLVIREATGDLGDWRLDGYTLFVTLEPCAMCATAICDSRISRVVFGAWDKRLGAAGSKYDILRDSAHGGQTEVTAGVLEHECARLLSDFFEQKRP